MTDRPKVNLNAIAELKNTTDDAVPPYMNSNGFTQSNLLTDVRLAIGFTACGIAGATFYYDYNHDFEKTKEYTLYAVIAYFTLNIFLTWWMWWIEGGKVYIGDRNGVKLVLESRSEKYSSMYELKIITIVAGESITTEVKNPYSSWYNQQGYFHSKPFVAFLHNSMLALSRKNPAAARLVSKETANVGNNLDN